MKRSIFPLILASLTLTGTSQAITYSIDSGTLVGAVGDSSATWAAAAVNHFTAVAGSQNIVSISVLFGGNPISPASGLTGGELFTVVLWNDPNNDGNPSDATVLGSASGSITTFDDNVTFQTTAIPGVGLSVGQSFFAGVYFNAIGNKRPLAASGPGSPGDSWVAYNAATPINLNSLGTSDAFGLLGTVTGSPGIVGMVRANGVPEPTAAVLAGLASLGLMRRRRNS